MNEQTLNDRVLSAVQQYLYGAKSGQNSDDFCMTMPTLRLPHGYCVSDAAETSLLCSSNATRSNSIGKMALLTSYLSTLMLIYNLIV